MSLPEDNQGHPTPHCYAEDMTEHVKSIPVRDTISNQCTLVTALPVVVSAAQVALQAQVRLSHTGHMQSAPAVLHSLL